MGAEDGVMDKPIVVTWAGAGLSWDETKKLIRRPSFEVESRFPGQVGTCGGRPVVREVTSAEWQRLIRTLRGGWLDDLMNLINDA